MAKVTKRIALKNCFIDEADPLNVQEISKDACKVYNIEAILKEFAGAEGVSISVSIDDEMPESGD